MCIGSALCISLKYVRQPALLCVFCSVSSFVDIDHCRNVMQFLSDLTYTERQANPGHVFVVNET